MTGSSVRAARLLAALVTVLAVLVSISPALGAWSNDPALNTAIADGSTEQVLPKIALTSDGGCYVAWFDNGPGGYHVRLQLLDRWGNEVWPHNGILVSDHPQSTSLVDWDVDADAADHAIVVFTDTRGGDDLDVFAYRISPTGEFVWGPDGITLSENAEYEPSPQCAALPDGNAVFVWPRIPDTGIGAIVVQKIAPDGMLLFGPAGIEIAGDPPQERPAFCNVVPADNGSFVISWIRDIRTFTSPRHLRAQKLSADGNAVWGAPVSVYDAFSLPIGYFPMTLPDDAGGAILGWHASTGNLYDSRVQHLTADGTQLFGHNGAAVSTQANIHHIEPSIAFRAASEEIFVFFQTRNGNQNQWGINAQKMTPAGARAWTDNGVLLLPMNTTYKGQPRCGVVQDGAVGFFFEDPTGSEQQDWILAFRLDAAGGLVWGASPLVVASTLSAKGRLPIAARPDGMSIAIWEDDRAGTIDVYGQNVNPDGTFGMSPASVPGPDEAGLHRIARCAPNPFTRSTEIAVAGPGHHESARILISDAAGRVLRRLEVPAGIASARWDGRDQEHNAVPAGTYFYRVETGGRVRAADAVTAIR